MKTKRINVRVTEKEKEVLSSISERLDIPEAIIVREAVKEKIAELSKKHGLEKNIELAV
jgi:predicted DNA-binding protein